MDCIRSRLLIQKTKDVFLSGNSAASLYMSDSYSPLTLDKLIKYSGITSRCIRLVQTRPRNKSHYSPVTQQCILISLIKGKDACTEFSVTSGNNMWHRVFGSNQLFRVGLLHTVNVETHNVLKSWPKHYVD